MTPLDKRVVITGMGAVNDKYEITAIKEVFGEYAYQVPIASTKSMTGHRAGATGALEVIFGLKAFATGVIPPTINYETPDPDCALDCAPNMAHVPGRYFYEQHLRFWRTQYHAHFETVCGVGAVRS